MFFQRGIRPVAQRTRRGVAAKRGARSKHITDRWVGCANLEKMSLLVAE
jgi:hypothetical protein